MTNIYKVTWGKQTEGGGDDGITLKNADESVLYLEFSYIYKH